MARRVAGLLALGLLPACSLLFDTDAYRSNGDGSAGDGGGEAGPDVPDADAPYLDVLDTGDAPYLDVPDTGDAPYLDVPTSDVPDASPSCSDSSTCGDWVCDLTLGRCVPCAAHAQCAPLVCNSDGRCAPCSLDSECSPRICVAGACEACTANLQCDGLACVSGTCQACTNDDQCIPGICTAGRCVPCVSHSDCFATGRPICVAGECRSACTSHSECDRTTCDLTEREVCVPGGLGAGTCAVCDADGDGFPRWECQECDSGSGTCAETCAPWDCAPDDHTIAPFGVPVCGDGEENTCSLDEEPPRDGGVPDAGVPDAGSSDGGGGGGGPPFPEMGLLPLTRYTVGLEQHQISVAGLVPDPTSGMPVAGHVLVGPSRLEYEDSPAHTPELLDFSVGGAVQALRAASPAIDDAFDRLLDARLDDRSGPYLVALGDASSGGGGLAALYRMSSFATAAVHESRFDEDGAAPIRAHDDPMGDGVGYLWHFLGMDESYASKLYRATDVLAFSEADAITGVPQEELLIATHRSFAAITYVGADRLWVWDGDDTSPFMMQYLAQPATGRPAIAFAENYPTDGGGLRDVLVIAVPEETLDPTEWDGYLQSFVIECTGAAACTGSSSSVAGPTKREWRQLVADTIWMPMGGDTVGFPIVLAVRADCHGDLGPCTDNVMLLGGNDLTRTDGWDTLDPLRLFDSYFLGGDTIAIRDIDVSVYVGGAELDLSVVALTDGGEVLVGGLRACTAL